MASFVAGQILRASELNSLGMFSADITGDSTATPATSKQMDGSLVIPAASIDRSVLAAFTASADPDAATGVWDFRIHQDDLNGVQRGINRFDFTHAAINTVNVKGRSFTLAAGTSLTLVVAVRRVGGTNVLTGLTGTGSAGLFAELSAVP